ncbi:MAG: MFS transporter, partial [Candidatus Latescibacteria bacterium]|nr:MFS transporter [Candidatus Latescibacterota bacterium]
MKKEWFLYTIAFLMDGCMAVVGLCVPLVALQLGATYDDLGMIGAVGAAIYSLSCLFSGRLADRFGYRYVMACATLLVGFVYVGYLFVGHIWHLVLLAGLMGVSIAHFWPPLQAWLGRGKSRQHLLKDLGRFNVAWSLGFVIGPMVGGIMFETQPSSAFLLGIVLMAVMFFAFVFLHIHERDDVLPNEAIDAMPLARLFLPMAFVANFATFFSIGTVRSLFPKLATDLGIAPGILGGLMALIGLAQLTAFYFMSRTDRWQFKRMPLILAQVLACVGLLLLALGKHPVVFALGLLMVGVLAGITFTVSIFYSLFTQGPGGRRTGFHEAIVGSGFLFGPLLGGVVGEHL